MGVLLKDKGKEFELVATDGHRLALGLRFELAAASSLQETIKKISEAHRRTTALRSKGQ